MNVQPHQWAVSSGGKSVNNLRVLNELLHYNDI